MRIVEANVDDVLPLEGAMNPIVEALPKDFCGRQEIDGSDTARAFENFVAYCILSAERLDQGDFRDSLTDEGEEGLDAIAIIVNGTLVADPSDIESLLETNSRLGVKYVFVQAKTSERWDAGSDSSSLARFMGSSMARTSDPRRSSTPRARYTAPCWAMQRASARIRRSALRTRQPASWRLAQPPKSTSASSHSSSRNSLSSLQCGVNPLTAPGFNSSTVPRPPPPQRPLSSRQK